MSSHMGSWCDHPRRSGGQWGTDATGTLCSVPEGRPVWERPNHRGPSDRYALGMFHGAIIGTGLGLILLGAVLAAAVL